MQNPEPTEERIIAELIAALQVPMSMRIFGLDKAGPIYDELRNYYRLRGWQKSEEIEAAIQEKRKLTTELWCGNLESNQ